MLSRSVTPVRVALAAVVLVAAASSAAPASASTPGLCKTCTTPPVVSPVAAAGSVAVMVSGTGVTSGGGSFTVPSRSVWVAPVCYYTRMGTGRQYADALNHGLEDSVLRMLPAAERSTPLPGWEEHQADDAGSWWIPVCDEPSRFDAYNALNDAVYVIPGASAPAGQAAVSPDVLAQVAYDQMDLPTGTIRWNPALNGSGATVVNMDTWVWVDDGPTTVSITAQVPGISATVEATLDHLALAAPGADPVTCTGAGVAWTTSADPAQACTIGFYRSSANQPITTGQSLPTSTLTATATWTASWTSSIDPTPTPLPDQDLLTTANIPVAEIQSIVTSN